MSEIKSYAKLTLPTNGTLDLYFSEDPLDSITQYIIEGSPTLIGNVSITSTNPDINVENRRYEILWMANPDYDGNSIQIFGANFTEANSETGGTIVVFNDGSSNTFNFYPNFQNGNAVKNEDIAPLTIDNTRIKDGEITSTKYATSSIPTTALSASNRLEVVTCNVSFETGEQGGYKIRFPYDCEVQALYAQVTKEIGAVDNATITPSNSVGDMPSIITIPFETSFGVVFPLDTSALANREIAINTDLTLTTLKTTAGGTAQVTIVVKRV